MSTLELAEAPDHVPPSAIYDFDLEHDPILVGEPHEGLSRLQRHAPELFYSRHYGGNWVARGHDVIHEILQDPERFASGGFEHQLLPIHANPPEHAYYRQVLLPAFAPKRVKALLPMIEQMAIELVDAAAPRGECEFVTAVAEPMPVIIFMKMLGIPLELMVPVRKLVIEALGTTDPVARGEVFNRQLVMFDPIIADHLAVQTDDMLGTIVASEIDGRMPSPEELRGYLLLLANAGLDTVVNAISFAIKHLAQDIDLQRRLRAEPELIPQAVEEFLRRYAPSTITRYATRDTEIGGCKIMAGERIVLLLQAGNLDESVYPDPCAIDLDRDLPSITFGTGIHRCLGSHLARMEMHVIIRECLARIPEFRLDERTQVKSHPGMVYTVDSLPLRWTARH